ncbi:hypothetical protein NLY43_01015 [Mesorhizobium sp. C416B]|uniref:hypothetical protein n=1 Tax=unclassified Mesorhizobium TaxID=325217 RepID=UPI0012ECACA4|nr:MULTISPECIES: hypothetical protein [unclassified Mesorhizobium]WJI63398.1 hypothetical protein NLY43_01015 [Mesorhizobium sp. C416B]
MAGKETNQLASKMTGVQRRHVFAAVARAMYDARIISAMPYVISVTDAHAVCAHLSQRVEGPLRPLGFTEILSPIHFYQLAPARAAPLAARAGGFPPGTSQALGATTAPSLYKA